MIVRHTFTASMFLTASFSGCATRELPVAELHFADVEASLNESCGPCHGGDMAEADWRVADYLSVIACPDDQGPAVEPPGAMAPILAVLERPDHRDLLSELDAERLRSWVSDGAHARVGAAHPGGWVDPRSAEFHGEYLRETSWVQMLDADTEGACTLCHTVDASDSGPVAEGATPCMSCHVDEGGPFACSTCHGQPGIDHPPRDLCFHPDESGVGRAHPAHLAANIECSVCHGRRTVSELGTSMHGDGVVQVQLDRERSGPSATWEPGSRTCTGSCHDRGGDLPTPSWDDSLELDCQSCHVTPPTDHFSGPCNSCHAEATSDGDGLLPGLLHANGRVDLGDGSGGCNACHGLADEWPTTGAHMAHELPMLAAPIACSECHTVPETVFDEGHLDDEPGAEVRFGSLASARGNSPQYVDGGCRDVACHGGGLTGGGLTTPDWEGTNAAGRCGACHGLPPQPPHTFASTCAAIACHGGLVGPGPTLTPAGRDVHVDGVIDLWPR